MVVLELNSQRAWLFWNLTAREHGCSGIKQSERITVLEFNSQRAWLFWN
jgi:hypothetical protein